MKLSDIHLGTEMKRFKYLQVNLHVFHQSYWSSLLEKKINDQKQEQMLPENE